MRATEASFVRFSPSGERERRVDRGGDTVFGRIYPKALDLAEGNDDDGAEEEGAHSGHKMRSCFGIEIE